MTGPPREASQKNSRGFRTGATLVLAGVCSFAGRGQAQVPVPGTAPAWQAPQTRQGGGLPAAPPLTLTDEDRTALAGLRALAGGSSGSQDVSVPLARQLLLALQMQERALLVDYGPDHPRVCAVRARMQAVSEFLQRQPVPSPVLQVQPARLPMAVQPASPQKVPAAVRPVPPPAPRPLAPLPTAPAIGLVSHQVEAATPRPTVSPAVPAPTPAPLVGNGRPTPQPEVQPAVSAPEPARSFFEGGLGQLISLVTALFLSVCLHLGLLLLFLRRYGPRWSRIIPWEPGFVAPAPPSTAGEPEAAAADGSAPAAEPLPESATAEQFDLGPTYEEEQALKREARRQQEEAVLRQIFELNLQLHAQLARLPASEA
jgi:hypothetical protein